MFFRLELALAALPERQPRTRRAVERLLPGPLTLLVPNPARRFPLAKPGNQRVDARRRRTFSVLRHPDAGKSPLTEALVLHAKAITEAGAIHGKAGRKSTVSDWMEMEKARGISITSTAPHIVDLHVHHASTARTRSMNDAGKSSVTATCSGAEGSRGSVI